MQPQVWTSTKRSCRWGLDTMRRIHVPKEFLWCLFMAQNYLLLRLLLYKNYLKNRWFRYDPTLILCSVVSQQVQHVTSSAVAKVIYIYNCPLFNRHFSCFLCSISLWFPACHPPPPPLPFPQKNFHPLDSFLLPQCMVRPQMNQTPEKNKSG